MAEKHKPIASPLAGQIAIQAMLAALARALVILFEDEDGARADLIAMAQRIIELSAIPDLAAADQETIRSEAKTLVGLMINGGTSRQN